MQTYESENIGRARASELHANYEVYLILMGKAVIYLTYHPEDIAYRYLETFLPGLNEETTVEETTWQSGMKHFRLQQTNEYGKPEYCYFELFYSYDEQVNWLKIYLPPKGMPPAGPL